MPILDRDDDQLWFDFTGSGTPLLLVPGLSGSATFWDKHLAELERRHLVVVHDHRGTGRSGRKAMDYSIRQMADDVLALADHLEIDRFHYIGHSTGGAIGQHLAVHHGERLRSMVLSSTWPGPDSYFQSLFTHRRDVLRDMGMTAYKRIASLMMKPPAFFPADAVADAMTQDETPQNETDVAITLSRIQALLAFDERAQLPNITTPTFVMCAKDDVVTPPHCSEEIANVIPNARLHLLESGGHFYPQVCPDEFLTKIVEFLERQS